MELAQQKSTDDRNNRIIEILSTIKNHQLSSKEMLSKYCLELEVIARKHSKTSDEIVRLAESNALPFTDICDVLELSLLIKNHKSSLE